MVSTKNENRTLALQERKSAILAKARASFVQPRSEDEAKTRWGELVALKKDIEWQVTSVHHQVRLRLPDRYAKWRGDAKLVVLHIEADLMLLRDWIGENNRQTKEASRLAKAEQNREDLWRMALIRRLLGGPEGDMATNPETVLQRIHDAAFAPASALQSMDAEFRMPTPHPKEPKP